MGRAARRAQQRAERRQRQQQQDRSGPRSPMTAPSVAVESTHRGSLLKPRWAMDIINELRKVTWPTRQETAHLTVVVVVVSVLFGIVLGGADLGFSWFIENTILR